MSGNKLYILRLDSYTVIVRIYLVHFIINWKYGSIVVKGDVKSGFCLNAEGDIEIWGTVGDASIKFGKSVTVKCGFIGTGKEKIEAKDNLHMRVENNQVSHFVCSREGCP